jgi:hypothetical protein
MPGDLSGEAAIAGTLAVPQYVKAKLKETSDGPRCRPPSFPGSLA